MRITTQGFRCEHAFTPENQVRIGGGRVGCRICRKERHDARVAGMRLTQDLPERNNPDGLLRRFSWQGQP